MAPTTLNADGTAVYKTNIRIPADRRGKAIIYSIWQRDDAGNEAFLNCSDIDIIPVSTKPWVIPAGAVQVGEPVYEPIKR